MTKMEHENTDPYPFYVPDETQQRREFNLLLDGWLEAHRTRPTVPSERVRFDVPTIVVAARAALKGGSSPYVTMLLTIAPQFLSPDDRELEVLEVGDE